MIAVHKLKQKVLLGMLALSLAGCATQPSTPEQSAASTPKTQVPETRAEPEKPPFVLGSFEPDTLYALVLAELAGHRKRFDLLLGNYLHQAKQTRDPGIAERATRIALYLKADHAALAAATLWAETDPDSMAAKQILAAQLVKAGELPQALVLMEALLSHQGETNFEYLAASTKDLGQSERNEILVEFNRLLARHPENTQLLYGKAILLQLSSRGDEALSVANRLYELSPSARNLLLRARLMHQLDKTAQAIKLLTKQLETDYSDRQIRLLYAQILIDTKSLEEAQRQFALLVEQNPWDNQMRLTLSLLAIENQDLAEARFQLEQVLNDEKLAEDAHYYLAQLDQNEQRYEEAIAHYRAVIHGDRAMSAHAQLGRILLLQKKPEELALIFAQSRQEAPDKAKRFYLMESELLLKAELPTASVRLLSQALEEQPNDINLLYARAIASEKANDLSAMEQDLRAILRVEPNNASVLNALGYALADRTDRYHEAMALIAKANELKPDDPAITDSLGWAWFRLGNYEESIKLLEKALAAMPDHEVAAHLGEVLWTAGEQERAIEVWQKALERDPDSPILRRVLERLNPELLR